MSLFSNFHAKEREKRARAEAYEQKIFDLSRSVSLIQKNNQDLIDIFFQKEANALLTREETTLQDDLLDQIDCFIDHFGGQYCFPVVLSKSSENDGSQHYVLGFPFYVFDGKPIVLHGYFSEVKGKEHGIVRLTDSALYLSLLEISLSSFRPTPELWDKYHKFMQAPWAFTSYPISDSCMFSRQVLGNEIVFTGDDVLFPDMLFHFAQTVQSIYTLYSLLPWEAKL